MLNFGGIIPLMSRIKESSLSKRGSFKKHKPIFPPHFLQCPQSLQLRHLVDLTNDIGGFIYLALQQPILFITLRVLNGLFTGIKQVSVRLVAIGPDVTILPNFTLIKFDGGPLRVAFHPFDKSDQGKKNKTARAKKQRGESHLCPFAAQ